MNLRKEIRHAFKAALLNRTGAAANVYVSRTAALWGEIELPAILIYTPNEAAEPFNESPRELKRTLEVKVEIASKADESLDDALDDIGNQVEAELLRGVPFNQTLDGLVDDLIYTGAELVLTSDGDKQQHGGLVMTYEVTYYTQEVAPNNELDAFESAGAGIKPVPSTLTSPIAELSVQLPQT